MLAQDKMLARCSSRRAPAFRPARGTSTLSSRTCQRPRILPAQALPTPQGDVISKDDSAVLVDLEQRFKMADIDGLVLQAAALLGQPSRVSVQETLQISPQGNSSNTPQMLT
jgi:hypothetical protein